MKALNEGVVIGILLISKAVRLAGVVKGHDTNVILQYPFKFEGFYNLRIWEGGM